MLTEAKAIQYAALLDEQHRQQHPKPVKDCEYCEYLETRVCDHCEQRPCTASFEEQEGEGS